MAGYLLVFEKLGEIIKVTRPRKRDPMVKLGSKVKQIFFLTFQLFGSLADN